MPMDKAKRTLMEICKVKTSSNGIEKKVYNAQKWKLERQTIEKNSERVELENRVNIEQKFVDSLADQLAEKKRFFRSIKEQKELQQVLLVEKRAEYLQKLKVNNTLADRIAQLYAEKKLAQERITGYEEQKQEIIHRIDQIYPVYEKELLDRYLKYKGNIRVFIRARPILPNDYTAYSGTRESFDLIQSQLVIPNSQQIELEMSNNNKGPAQGL